jgi:hypothetical protein
MLNKLCFAGKVIGPRMIDNKILASSNKQNIGLTPRRQPCGRAGKYLA